MKFPTVSSPLKNAIGAVVSQNKYTATNPIMGNIDSHLKKSIVFFILTQIQYDLEPNYPFTQIRPFKYAPSGKCKLTG